MEPSTCKISESEEDYVEEEDEEECDEGEVTVPSNPSQQTLSKTDCQAFGNGAPLSIVATKIPEKLIAPADLDDTEVGKRRRRRKCRPLAINLTNCKYESAQLQSQGLLHVPRLVP